MYSYQYGGKQGISHQLVLRDDYVVIRTQNRQELEAAVSSAEAKQLLPQLQVIAAHQEAGIFVVTPRVEADGSETAAQARQVLKREEQIRFAGRVLTDPASGVPFVYTENLFVQFDPEMEAEACQSALEHHQLTVKKRLTYANNAYFVGAPQGTGLQTFEIAQTLLNEPKVLLCHPELISEHRSRQVAAAIPAQQWHLRQTEVDGVAVDAFVNVADAWEVTKGKGVAIAIVDDGVDVDHIEFSGSGKVIHPRDVTEQVDDARPKDANPMYGDDHGTPCAGVACASGLEQAFGVAPEATLMPIRLASGLGSQAEIDAFVWAVEHGADIISCSWGPVDGPWWDPENEQHKLVTPLPDSTRLALDYAVEKGRDGKGCVITWAAGNGNESVDNDGYASYDKVIAVAACNDDNKRSIYSDFGKAIWCTFPSSDIGFPELNHPDPKTSGIWTTDRVGAAGYNPGNLDPNAEAAGDDSGHYTETFGGTSSACPGVAGIAALILAANPELRWDEVREILRRSAVKIDLEGGQYDADGHSPLYGYGRPDPAVAVKLAIGGDDSDDGDEPWVDEDEDTVGNPKTLVAAIAFGILSVALLWMLTHAS